MITLIVGMHTSLTGLICGMVTGRVKEVYNYLDYSLSDKQDMLYTWTGTLIGFCLIHIVKLF